MNETFQMEPIVVNDIITQVGVPTGPVQDLVKYFIGLTPSEHISNEQSKLKLHWEPPLIGLQHGPITSYNVLYIREQKQYITYGPDPQTIIIPSLESQIVVNTTTIILDNLNPDTNYIIHVYPRTDTIGQGPENKIRLKTSVAAPPKPPILSIISVTDQDITISWPSLTNETGEITKVWIVVEPYEPLQLTSEVVHISNNMSVPLLPFPHEGIRGHFGPYNISDTCQSHIVGLTFLSINTKEICGGFCNKKCEYGTEMLDPTTIFPTNDKTLINDNFIMLFNNSDGVISSRYVPYLTMKKRINLTSADGGLNSAGTFLIGDGLNNIKSKLNNTLLNVNLLYRFRFIVFTSETLYSISDSVKITLLEESSVSIIDFLYVGIVLSIVLIIIIILFYYCAKSRLNRKIGENIIDNSNIDIDMESIIYKKIEIKNQSVTNPSYWNGQNITDPNYNNESSYMDVSVPSYLQEYSVPNTYLDVDNHQYSHLSDTQQKWIDVDIYAPPLPDKKGYLTI